MKIALRVSLALLAFISGGLGMWSLIGIGVVPAPHFNATTGALHSHSHGEAAEDGQRHHAAVARRAASGAAEAEQSGGSSIADYFGLPDLPGLLSSEPSRIVYLNREGVTLVPGDEQASRNRSTIVRRAGVGTVKIPGFSGSQRAWRRVLRCVQDKFAPFDVIVTDRRPVHTDNYVMAVFGGTARLLGRSHRAAKGTGGLAPFNGQSIPRSTAFVFTKTLHNDVRQICETAAMEVAHTYGLDHSYACKDLMTYRPRCGPRQFLNQDVRCGEAKPRPCAGGAKTQNAYARLAELLGLRPVARPQR